MWTKPVLRGTYIIMENKIALTLLVLAAAGSSLLAGDKIDINKLDLSKLPPPATKQGVTYATDIRPILEASCVRCHGQERPKARLRLDSLEGLLKGGEDGKVVLPGDSKQSLLVIAMARIDKLLSMRPEHYPGRGGPGRPGRFGPPDGPPPHPPGEGPGGPGGFRGHRFGPPPKPLTAEQVGLVRAWIDQGAK